MSEAQIRALLESSKDEQAKACIEYLLNVIKQVREICESEGSGRMYVEYAIDEIRSAIDLIELRRNDMELKNDAGNASSVAEAQVDPPGRNSN